MRRESKYTEKQIADFHNVNDLLQNTLNDRNYLAIGNQLKKLAETYSDNPLCILHRIIFSIGKNSSEKNPYFSLLVYLLTKHSSAFESELYLGSTIRVHNGKTPIQLAKETEHPLIIQSVNMAIHLKASLEKITALEKQISGSNAKLRNAQNEMEQLETQFAEQLGLAHKINMGLEEQILKQSPSPFTVTENSKRDAEIQTDPPSYQSGAYNRQHNEVLRNVNSELHAALKIANAEIEKLTKELETRPKCPSLAVQPTIWGDRRPAPPIAVSQYTPKY